MLTQCASYAPGNTDLAWTRITPWRALLAAAMDQVDGKVTGSASPPSGSARAPTCSAPGSSDRLRAPVTPEAVRRSRDHRRDAHREARRRSASPRGRSRGDPHRSRAAGPPGRAPAARRSPSCSREELRRLDPDDVYAATVRRLSQMSSPRQASGPGPSRGRGAARADRCRSRSYRLPDADAVAQRVASDRRRAPHPGAGSEGRIPRLVLTGGTIARKVHADVAGSRVRNRRRLVPGRPVVGRRALRPAEDDGAQRRPDLGGPAPARARSIPTRVHAMPASDDEYADADAAAWAYAQDLREAVGSNSTRPGSTC